eukprot:TRINITY_DN1874_c0_g1_i1.p1 TRINITY_DN1874_c0_g1~~TRINITY_DN1874_c0_g1_i1.p1  ORF type:complete len:425 (-),score=69.02 TRINITY_DN1874_c0_g1_i1:118-1392(-)
MCIRDRYGVRSQTTRVSASFTLMDSGNLVVTVLQAKNLKVAELNGKSSPWVKVVVGEKNERTKTKIKTISPIWNEVFTFKYDSLSNHIIDVQIWHTDRLYRSYSLGSVAIDISLSANLPKAWYPLHETTSGEIQLKVDIISPENFKKQSEEFVQSNNYKIHFDKVGGTLLATQKLGKLSSNFWNSLSLRSSAPQAATPAPDETSSDPPSQTSVAGSYPVYRIKMYYIKEIFGDKVQQWNREYPKAQQIFGNTTSACLIRSAITAQHKSLYSTLSYDEGDIKGGEQLLNLINYGLRNGKRKMYTYVLTDDKLYFSETSASFFKDFLSKHATHSNARTEVRYAGEFHVQQYQTDDEQIRHKLIIDNNSGTYAPAKDQLPLLKQALEANFPELEVEALDFNDEQLEKYKVKLREKAVNLCSSLDRKK